MTAPSSAAAEGPPGGRFEGFRERYGLLIDAATLVVLLALAFFGIATSDADWSLALPYWSLVTLLYALGTFVLAWVHGAFARGFFSVALRLVGHWIGVLVAVHGIFYYMSDDQLTEGQAGLVLGMVFALGTFLAGIHVQWRLMIVGAALAASSAAVAFAQENDWLVMAILVAGFIVVLAVDRLRGKRRTPA